MHLQGEAQDRMNALMERTQELGMHFTHSVVDPATLGTLQLTGGLAGGCCRAVGDRGRCRDDACDQFDGEPMLVKHQCCHGFSHPTLLLAEAAQRLPVALRRRLQPLANPGSGAVVGLAAPGDTPMLHSLLRNAADEGLRRAAWEACHQTPASNLGVLDALVEVRASCCACCACCASCGLHISSGKLLS